MIQKLKEGIRVPTLHGPTMVPNSTLSRCVLHFDIKYNKYVTLQADGELVHKYIQLKELQLILDKVSTIFDQSYIKGKTCFQIMCSTCLLIFAIVGCILPLVGSYVYSSTGFGYGIILYFTIIVLFMMIDKLM